MRTQKEYREAAENNKVEHVGLDCLRALNIGVLILEFGEQGAIEIVEKLISGKAEADEDYVQGVLLDYCF